MDSSLSAVATSERTVELTLERDCGLAACNFTAIALEPENEPPDELALPSLHADRNGDAGVAFAGQYVAGIDFPLVGRNFTYVLRSTLRGFRSRMTSASCLGKKVMSNEVAERIFAVLLNDDQEDSKRKNESACECDFAKIGRIDVFNEYKLPSPYYYDMRTYFYSHVSKTMGQFELLYTTDPKCAFNASAFRQNDVFPTVRYGVGIFREGDEAIAAWGYFVHVFVERAANKSVPIPDPIRAALERIA